MVWELKVHMCHFGCLCLIIGEVIGEKKHLKEVKKGKSDTLKKSYRKLAAQKTCVNKSTLGVLVGI